MHREVTEADIGKWIEVTNNKDGTWDSAILVHVLKPRFNKRFIVETGACINGKLEPWLYTYARIEDKGKRFEHAHTKSGIGIESVVQVVRYQDLNISEHINAEAKDNYEQYGLVVGESLAGDKSVFRVLFKRNSTPVDIPYYCLEEQRQFNVTEYGKPGQTVYRLNTANLSKTYEILTLFKCDGNEYVVVSPNFEEDDAKPFIVDEAKFFVILTSSDLTKE